MRTVLILGTVAVLLAACRSGDPSVVAEQRGRPVIVVGLWPLAEVVQHVAGDEVVVVNLTPVGDEPHGLTLTPRQAEEVAAADLAIVIGGGLQPAVEREAAMRDGPTLDVLDALELSARPDGSDGPADPHVWLDPTIMGSIVTVVSDAVARVIPDDARSVEARAASLVEKHVELDAQLGQALRSCTRTLIVSQHEAFGWFAARYGLRAVALDGPAPDDDPAPDPGRLALIEPLLDDGSVATVFTEPLSPTSWLEIIAEERGLDTAVLDPYEGLTLRTDAVGTSYRRAQLENLKRLATHLDCESA